jgi:hypothetical protein
MPRCDGWTRSASSGVKPMAIDMHLKYRQTRAHTPHRGLSTWMRADGRRPRWRRSAFAGGWCKGRHPSRLPGKAVGARSTGTAPHPLSVDGSFAGRVAKGELPKGSGLPGQVRGTGGETARSLSLDFPKDQQLRSLFCPPPAPGSLPGHLPPLFDRARERAELGAQRHGQARLTIAGPAGVGKTALVAAAPDLQGVAQAARDPT